MSGTVAAATQDAWFAYDGMDNDVVLSTRLRLTRNLANFPFPAKLRGTDGGRIQQIVVDAFNHLPDCESYQAIPIDHLDTLGSKILQERGILYPQFATQDSHDCGVILCTDGTVACTINMMDHVRIASFAPGMDFDATWKRCKDIDDGLQRRIQFAASHDFGYLTSALMDAGSGMHLSLRVHLPSLSLQGKIRGIAEDLTQEAVMFTASYGNGAKGSSLGSYYELSSTNAQSGSELDQIASIVSCGKKLAEMERTARAECKASMPSVVRNDLYRSLALARASLFISLREAIDIISAVKLGVDMALVDGIGDAALHALLYRIQEGHLEYVLKNGQFDFEQDIRENVVKKNERLRAMILQEAFEGVRL